MGKPVVDLFPGGRSKEARFLSLSLSLVSVSRSSLGFFRVSLSKPSMPNSTFFQCNVCNMSTSSTDAVSVKISARIVDLVLRWIPGFKGATPDS